MKIDRDFIYVFNYYNIDSKKVGFTGINLDSVIIIYVGSMYDDKPIFRIRVKNKRYRKGYWDSGDIWFASPLDFYAKLKPKGNYKKKCLSMKESNVR